MFSFNYLILIRIFRFYGPDFLCRLVKFGQVFPLYLSSFILTLMSIDRVGVIRRRRSKAGGRGSSALSGPRSLVPLIQMAWALAVAFALPQLVIFSKQEINEHGTLDCWAGFAGNRNYEKVKRSLDRNVILWAWSCFKWGSILHVTCYNKQHT